MGKQVAVIVSHPDDEVLGCGGTMAKHVAAGDTVTVWIMTDGVSSRRPEPNVNTDVAKLAADRKAAARKAAGILGASANFIKAPQPVGDTPLQDQRLDGYDLLEVIRCIEDSVMLLPPQIIYTHHLGDLNADHRITAQAVLTAFRPVPGSTVEAIYAFEVPSSTEWASSAEQSFRPDTFVDIMPYMNQKMVALTAYDMEMRPYPHPRSHEAVRALAQWRGAIVGLERAEAFVTLRRIER